MTTLVKPSYVASAVIASTTLQTLANSAGGVIMWSSAVLDNSSNLSMDEMISWKIVAGTSPTAGAVGECWLWEMMDDTNYPDTITGADAAVTLTSLNVKLSGAFKFANSITFDATTGRVYYNTFRLSQAFGMSPPKKWGAGFVNISGVALGSGNLVSRTPIQFQNV